MMIPSSLNLTKRNEKLDFLRLTDSRNAHVFIVGGEGGGSIRGPFTPLVRTPIIPPPTTHSKPPSPAFVYNLTKFVLFPLLIHKNIKQNSKLSYKVLTRCSSKKKGKSLSFLL